MLRRARSAVPYVIASAAAGFLIAVIFGLSNPFVLAAGTATATTVLIGQTIWRERS